MKFLKYEKNKNKMKNENDENGKSKFKKNIMKDERVEMGCDAPDA